MNQGFNEFKETILSAEKPVEFKELKEGSFRTYSLPIISISIIAILLLILPACAKADFNSSANLGTNTSINQSASAYLSGFDEGYRLGVLVVLAQSNATIAEEYNILVQQHNDLLNKTFSEEKANSNLLAKVPIPSMAPKKPYDPWEL